jgi:predicted TIM-barrel fold metal-dependent hydrolase
MRITESQRQEYLDHALDLQPKEVEKVEEYSEWLPPVVIDAHAHANLPEHVIDIPEKAYNHMISTFPAYTIEESQRVHAIFHPGTKIRSIRFANVFKGIAHPTANAYLMGECPEGDQVALYGIPDDVHYTMDLMVDPRVAGLKMYYSYLDPNASQVYEIFKPEILEMAERESIPIILHTPRVITESVSDILAMKTDFPQLKISIAHLGSSKFDIPRLQDAYDVLAESTDVVMDTALNPSEIVCYRAIKTFGSNRIMYGTDEPFNLLRSVPYIHPSKGQRIITSHFYHWQDPVEYSEYRDLANGAVHAHWLCLDALRAAIEKLPSEDQDRAKLNIFHDNASRFFGFDSE